MNKTLALMLASLVWLGGCSGRTDDPSATEDPLEIGAAIDAANEEIRLVTSSPSLLTGTGETASISAVVVDEQNRVVADREINFSADGGVLQNIISTTNEIGEATAELSLAGDYRNRNITVTATHGSRTASILVAATGTSIEMTAPETIIIGDTAELAFTLTAGNDGPIPNQTIAFLSEAGNTFSQNSAITDANGVARIAVSTTAGADVINVTAVEGTVDQNFDLTVVENEAAVVTPVRVRVISNQSSIETGGNDVARITTLVTDESNRVISGKSVNFSSTGGVLQNISAVTNEAGQANAELSLAGDYRNQDITVSAQVDDQTGTVLVTTSGSSLSVSGPTALVSGNTAELEITLSSGNGQPIANEVVSLTSSAGNTLSADTVTTDSSGKATVTVGSTAGNDSITVSALGATVTRIHNIQVAADILSVVNPDSYSALEVDTASQFQVLWESSGAPVVNELLKFTITAGAVRAVGDTSDASSVVVATDASGIATIEVESTAAGAATIAFSDANDADPFSQFDVEFVAVDVAHIAVESTPASVATGNSSTMLATVTDTFGNPVKNIDVEFSSPDLNGGTLSPVTAQTDSDGQARITFEAGDTPTAENELVITATVADTPAVSASTNLTVTERQLNVIIGLAGDLTEADADTRYRRAGLVQVTDGAGRPVSDATILVSMIPETYTYGNLVQIDSDGDGEPDAWGYGLTHTCVAEDKNKNRILDTVNEDLNGNSVLDTGEDTNQNGLLDIDEDVNNNGVLDPSDPGLVDADPVNAPTVIGGQITTDANGVGFFSLAYPQSNAWWFEVQIIARVQALGVEGVATYETGLDAIASDVNEV
ncbi:MAG: Ig-like domain-containing protein, partial [Pseudomonadota bacterium]